MSTGEQPDVSICIVSLNAKDYLNDCLDSIENNTHRVSYEIIIVDNGSTDGTFDSIQSQRPQVKLYRNNENNGYSAPMNQALRTGIGRHLMQLNPDTIVHPGSLDRLVAFLDTHPDVGIVGPKVLNPNGSLQEPCRRSEARPWDVMSYFSGLARLFPDDRRFSGYYMGYMDENETHEAEGVSGSCMLMRSTMIEQVGYLDESLFAYQEDADYCFRARQAGWKIFYYPEAEITHFGGEGGSKVQPFRSIWAWHRAYYLYYKKHLAKDYFFLFNWLYYLLMLVKFVLTVIRNFVARDSFGGSRKPG